MPRVYQDHGSWNMIPGHLDPYKDPMLRATMMISYGPQINDCLVLIKIIAPGPGTHDPGNPSRPKPNNNANRYPGMYGIPPRIGYTQGYTLYPMVYPGHTMVYPIP